MLRLPHPIAEPVPVPPRTWTARAPEHLVPVRPAVGLAADCTCYLDDKSGECVYDMFADEKCYDQGLNPTCLLVYPNTPFGQPRCDCYCGRKPT